MEKIRIAFPIIVEGKYDKNTLSQIFDAKIFTVGGFAIFNSKEKQALLRRIAENGVIVLTDSDGGGRQIRSFLTGILPKGSIHNLHIPRVEGKERRKDKASRSGLLGVEGMERDVLVKLLAPFTEDGGRVAFSHEKAGREITKLDFFEDGLSGSDNAAARRAAICRCFDLPEDMTAKELLEALNLLVGYDDYRRAVDSLAQ